MIDKKKIIKFLENPGNIEKLLKADITEMDAKGRITRDTGTLAFFPNGCEGPHQLLHKGTLVDGGHYDEGLVSFDVGLLKSLIRAAEDFGDEVGMVLVSTSKANPLFIKTPQGVFAIAPRIAR